MGFDPNVAILMSGVGTLIFFFVTGGKVPSYLGSSFAFIGVVIAATGYAGTGANANIAVALGGIVVCGLRLRADRHRGRANQRIATAADAGLEVDEVETASRALDRAADAAGRHRRGRRGDRPQPGVDPDQEHGAHRLRHLDAGADLRQRRPGRGLHARHGAAPADPGRPDRRQRRLRGADQRPRPRQADRLRRRRPQRRWFGAPQFTAPLFERGRDRC